MNLVSRGDASVSPEVDACTPAASTPRSAIDVKAVGSTSPYSRSPNSWSCSLRPSRSPYLRAPVDSLVLGSTVARQAPVNGTARPIERIVSSRNVSISRPARATTSTSRRTRSAVSAVTTVSVSSGSAVCAIPELWESRTPGGTGASSSVGLGMVGAGTRAATFVTCPPIFQPSCTSPNKVRWTPRDAWSTRMTTRPSWPSPSRTSKRTLALARLRPEDLVEAPRQQHRPGPPPPGARRHVRSPARHGRYSRRDGGRGGQAAGSRHDGRPGCRRGAQHAPPVGRGGPPRRRGLRVRLAAGSRHRSRHPEHCRLRDPRGLGEPSPGSGLGSSKTCPSFRERELRRGLRPAGRRTSRGARLRRLPLQQRHGRTIPRSSRSRSAVCSGRPKPSSTRSFPPMSSSHLTPVTGTASHAVVPDTTLAALDPRDPQTGPHLFYLSCLAQSLITSLAGLDSLRTPDEDLTTVVDDARRPPQPSLAGHPRARLPAAAVRRDGRASSRHRLSSTPWTELEADRPP